MADVPLLRNDDEVDPYGIEFLDDEELAEIDGPVHLCFNSPIPKNPRMVDYHSLPDTVFSKKIIDVLNLLDIEGVQFVPAVVNGKNGESYDNYWIVNAYNPIKCFDKEKSVYKICSFSKCWSRIEKLYLDKELLADIPLPKRLIFKPKETSQFELYHQSVVDAIMAVNPEGVQFIPVDGWYEGIQFEMGQKL